jgi:hypothetical protein
LVVDKYMNLIPATNYYYVHLQVLRKDKVTHKLTGEFGQELKVCNENVQELSAENHKQKDDINWLLGVEDYEDIKESVALLHPTVDDLKDDKALVKDMQDKIIALEKELLNKAETEERVVTLQTKACQLQAQVEEYKEEIYALNYKVSCTRDDLENEKSIRMHLENKIFALEEVLLNEEKIVFALKTRECQLEAQVAECKAMETECEQERHALNDKVRCTQDDLENEKVMRMYFENKIFALEEELLNREEIVLALKTRECQLEAQVAECKEREKAYEQERQLYLQTSRVDTDSVQNHVREYIHDTGTWEGEEKEQEETLIEGQEALLQQNDKELWNLQHELDDPYWLTGMNGNFS